MSESERIDEIRRLAHELEEAKVKFAQLYLRGRSGPKIAGRDPTTDDARMGARLAMQKAGVRDPESLRFELYALLGLTHAAAED